MSFRLKLIFALCSAVLAGAIVGRLLNWRAGLAVCVATLAGILLGRFTYQNNEKLSEPFLPSAIIEPTAHTSFHGPTPANALLEATMNGMREGVIVVDEKLQVVTSNSAARVIFSRVEGALERRRVTDLTRNAAVHAAFHAAIEQGTRAEVKVELYGAQRFVFDLSVVPLRLGNDRSPRGAIGVFFDITQLERLERVRQEFLSNVSHELRTPLTSIIAFVETLQDGALDDPENSRRFLSIISKNAARMHNLIDDILELSAIEAGNVIVEIKNVQLYPLVGDIITALASSDSARSIVLHNQVCVDATVQADARRLEQMLTNLISNAIKFNREGGAVTIRHEALDGRDRIEVTDTGEGIPAEHVERIFERFYRVDRARSREMGGTGLGLAIVKHLARAHDGEVHVQSTPGEGSTFIIELPAGIEPTGVGGEREISESRRAR